MTIAGTPPGGIYEPAPDQFSQPFWDATAEHRLIIPRCNACSTSFMPPAPFCCNCTSTDIGWLELSGDGTLYSYTIVRRALIPQLEDAVPFVFAVVEVPEAPGVRFNTNVVNVDIEDVKIDMPLRVVFHELQPGFTYPRFEPIAG